jgi:NTP pyrophosphatase (non-canonical NTP hydrolase)
VLCLIVEELQSARSKFPSASKSMCALTEEVGELAKALLDESNERVVEEAVQVAVTAIRVATEGDASLGR